MWLASEAPERVERLVLCCTAASFDPDAYSSRARTVREHGVAEVADAVLERWFTPAFREGHPGRRSSGPGGCCAIPRRRATRGVARRSPAPTWRGGLAASAPPRSIIAGAEDPAAPPERSESIRDSVPDARLEVLSPAAHLANVESPEAMTGAILEHLQAAPGEGT